MSYSQINTLDSKRFVLRSISLEMISLFDTPRKLGIVKNTK